MSKWVELFFQMGESLRREQQRARLRESARSLHQRFSALVQDMITKGYHRYLPSEFGRAQQDLAAIAQNLDGAPETAQRVCARMASYVTGLPLLAERAIREFEAKAKERMAREEKERQETLTWLDVFIREQVNAITDPIVRDFVQEDARSIRRSREGQPLGAGGLDQEKERIRHEIQSIRAAAEGKADAWKQRKQQEVEQEAQKALVTIHREEVARQVDENPRALKEVLAGLDALKARLDKGSALAPGELMRDLQATTAKAETAILDERCRRETVKAVMQSLQRAGFVLETPTRQVAPERDEVVVLARKPAGHRAEFRVTLDGGLSYKFDRYEGKTCKQDINKVLPMLQEIYGIKLSDERVLWENPTPEAQTARPFNPGTEAESHGA